MTRFDWEGAKPVLLDLLAAGKSAQQIAAEIGTTRHAVIGFIHRNPELKELWAGRSELS